MISRLFKRPRRKTASPYPKFRPYTSPAAGRRRRPVPDRAARIHVPLAVLKATDAVMRRFGRERRECYVWWAGYFTSDGDAQIVTAVHPEVATDYGRVHLGTCELAHLQGQLRALDQVLLVELHTHPPGAGGQNDVDAAHPAATYAGFITIVVPDFAEPRFYDLRDAYVYEYQHGGAWRQLGSEEIAKRFVVEETSVQVGA